jgi:eukaryotic-like serine/threonine-protein kinase
MIGRIFLGRYEITRLLGEGGMGRVYLARQVDLGRQVVVKVMHEQIAADAKFRERFQRETLLMARFQHPYAVTLYDASLDDPLGPCIIMEYVKGVNLDALLARNGRFTPARVGRLLGQLCEVLQAAHDQQIIHRDLKPGNLMVVDAESPREKIKVMDFGLAKMIDPATLKKITDTNVDFAVGTPGYICPEQVRGEDVDFRGDIYSVGVLAYELLAGRLPFECPNSMDMLLAHATELPPTFADLELNDNIPPAVEAVVMQCLEKDASKRPQSARELAAAYDQALAESETVVSERPTPADTPLPSRGPEKPFQAHFTAAPDDPNALLLTFKAWMPEKVALIKLRGYCYDFHGEIIESQPGLIRVVLPGAQAREPNSSGGPLSWLGLTRKPNTTTLELRLIQDDPLRENLLSIEARFRPGGGGSIGNERWRARCVQHFINLRGYLMGQVESV